MPSKGAPYGNTYAAGPHNVSPEGRRGLQRNGRRKGKKLLQDKKGLFAPGFLQSPKMRKTRIRNDEKLRQEERGIYAPGYLQSPEMQDIRRRNAEQLAQDQKGIFAPDFYDRPEIKKAHHENGIVQGKAAVERGDGIHAPGVSAFGGRRSYELGHGPFTNDNPKFESYWSYGQHRRWHELGIRKADSKFCRFCDTEEGRKEAAERAK